jgi:glycosyltransferase involved in cell wall biosynthesis
MLLKVRGKSPTSDVLIPNRVGTPFFSVVLPTYNRAVLLEQAVHSVLTQTYPDFELIVVDDHSTDNTRQVIDTIADPRLVYMSNQRGKGGASARNTGIFHAQGQWVAFLDDDDLWFPEKLEVVYDKIGSVGNDVGLIYSAFQIHHPYGTVEIRTPKYEGKLRDKLFFKNVIGGFFTVVIRKDILWQVNGLDERFPAMQDIELYIRVTQVVKTATVKKPLVKVQRHNTDRISLSMAKRVEAATLMKEKYHDLISGDKRLRHRIEAELFIFGILSGDFKTAFRSLGWVLMGIFVDIKYFLGIIPTIVKTQIYTWLVMINASKNRIG